MKFTKQKVKICTNT